jgi:hypothetical protein
MKGQKEAPSKNVVCVMSGAIALRGNPQGLSFREGEVFSPDHPAVKGAPLYFAPVDATSEEIHEAQVKIQAMPLRGSNAPTTRPVKADGLQVIKY